MGKGAEITLLCKTVSILWLDAPKAFLCRRLREQTLSFLQSTGHCPETESSRGTQSDPPLKKVEKKEFRSPHCTKRRQWG
jgi:hypothetical protein